MRLLTQICQQFALQFDGVDQRQMAANVGAVAFGRGALDAKAPETRAVVVEADRHLLDLRVLAGSSQRAMEGTVHGDEAAHVAGIDRPSTRERSQIGGTKSSPIPSTSHDPASPTVPVAT